MTESQKVEQATVVESHDEVVALAKAHAEAMEVSVEDADWIQDGMHHILLQTKGRKTGVVHRVALPFWRDVKGNRIVVASFAGAPRHPSWFVNLSDRSANPRVLCRTQTGRFWSVPEVLDGYDYMRTWSALTTDRSWYNEYQARTARRIPLVRLPESEHLASP